MNGISLEEFQNKSSFEFLELIMEEAHTIYPMKDFQSLKTLILVNCDLKSTNGLEGCPQLEELYLSENSITCIEGLENLVNLRTLVLDFNQIPSISCESIKGMKQLRKLSINRNFLTSLEGVQHLESLKELHVSKNKLKTIEHEFLRLLPGLETLNVAGNPIAYPEQVLPLLDYSSLSSLILSDKMFGVSPLYLSANFSLFQRIFFPKIKFSDAQETEPSTTEAILQAKTTVQKIKMKLFFEFLSNLPKMLTHALQSLANAIHFGGLASKVSQTTGFDAEINREEWLKKIEIGSEMAKELVEMATNDFLRLRTWILNEHRSLGNIKTKPLERGEQLYEECEDVLRAKLVSDSFFKLKNIGDLRVLEMFRLYNKYTIEELEINTTLNKNKASNYFGGSEFVLIPENKWPINFDEFSGVIGGFLSGEELSKIGSGSKIMKQARAFFKEFDEDLLSLQSSIVICRIPAGKMVIDGQVPSFGVLSKTKFTKTKEESNSCFIALSQSPLLRLALFLFVLV